MTLPILVVDDDAAMRDMLETILVDEGYHVVIASNGQEALQRIHQQAPALVLLDLMMPVMDGWQFLEALRKMPQYQQLPVLLLSASRDVARTATLSNVKNYLPKPFELDKLLSYVEDYSHGAGV